jgi:hypothetical protein
MTEQMQMNREHRVPNTVLDDPCPRCGSATVRVILYGPLDFEVEAVDTGDLGASDLGTADIFSDAPIFDCSDCNFEWGLAVRDLLA